MANKTYRVGIIGGREIAVGAPQEAPTPPLQNEIFHSHAASLSQVPRAEIAGFCDHHPELLDRIKQTWGSRWPDAHFYTDYKEMLDKEDLDILTVATPDTTHAAMTIDGANAGVKAVFCEKPMATSLEDADRMIQVCEQKGVVLTIDHHRRWSPLYHRVRDEIRAGTIGQLGTIVATLGGPNAMLFHNDHILDAICFFAESEPTQVFAHLEEGFEDWDRYKGDGGKRRESEPGASGLIVFDNGVRALYGGVKNTFKMFSLQLSGPDGEIYVNDRTAHLTTGPRPMGEGRSQPLLPAEYQVQGLPAAYEELIDNIESGGTSISSGREARKTLRIAIAFLNSHQEGSRLVDVPS